MQIIKPGDVFGRLTVIRETTKEERVNKEGRNYLCQCQCGNQKIVYGRNLKNGTTKSCGCLSRETASKNNSKEIPIGTKFGKLTVISRAPVRPGGFAYWKCKCECGNTCEVSGHNLRNKHTLSCGCDKRKNIIDETGNTYGYLTVKRYAGSRPDGGSLWECDCLCGNTIITRGDSLRSGHTRSCGCVKSYKEIEITQLLSKYNINFCKEYTFSDLKTDKGGTLRFDFAIFNKNNNLVCLIEYQGSQHFDTTSNWYSEEYIVRDEIKKIIVIKIILSYILQIKILIQNYLYRHYKWR